MNRFDRIPWLDDLFFVIALTTAAAFAADRYFEQEHEKTLIAQAKQGHVVVAQASEPCRLAEARQSGRRAAGAMREAPCEQSKAGRPADHAPF